MCLLAARPRGDQQAQLGCRSTTERAPPATQASLLVWTRPSRSDARPRRSVSLCTILPGATTTASGTAGPFTGEAAPLGSADCWCGRDPRTQTRFRTLRVFGSVGQLPITPAPRPESALLVVDGRGSGWADDATMREPGDERGARPIWGLPRSCCRGTRARSRVCCLLGTVCHAAARFSLLVDGGGRRSRAREAFGHPPVPVADDRDEYGERERAVTRPAECGGYFLACSK